MAKVTPSGWRWLAIRGGLLLGCALIVLATWLIWNWQATRRMDQLVAEIRSRGEPVLWSEVPVDDAVPDEQNAAWYLKQAMAGMSGVPATPIAGVTRPQLGSAPWRKMAQPMVAQNAAIFPLVRKARECTRSCWAARPPGGGPPSPNYANVVNLARLVRDKAILHHQRGEEAQAIECWRDVEAMSRSIGQQPLLISGLMSAIIDEVAQETINEIAIDIRAGEGGLSAEEIRSLVEELLGNGRMVEVLVGSMAEGQLNVTDIYLTGRIPSTAVARPLALSIFARSITDMRAMAQATREMRPMTQAKPNEVERLVGFSSQLPKLPDMVIQHVLRRRAAAITLAVQLYRHEHGSYPTNMEQLLPLYLPEIPADPRSTTGRKLEYLLLENGSRPVVVSPGDLPGPYKVPGQRSRPYMLSAPSPNVLLWMDASRETSDARDRDPDKPNGERDGDDPEQDVNQ